MPPKIRSTRQAYSKPTKSQKLNTMARKKDERAVRAAHKKEKQAQKYLPNDVSVASFLIQLHKLGLQLRNIPGDGNCLFRALGDQLDGHGRGHRKHRHDVVEFMSEHRGDFEPFVEDDVPFDRHVECLSCPGTYAGNDAIVAFARLHQLTVVIHQLNSPIWEIHGSDKPNSKQVHISYHNGDHYSSVRRLGDDSELPANIRFVNGAVLQNEKVVMQGSKQNGQKYSSTSPDNGYHVNGYDDYAGSDLDDTPVSKKVTDPELLAVIENIRHVTKCSDTKLITDLLEDNAFDFESTIASILQIMSGSSGNSSGHQTSSDSDTPSTPVGDAASPIYMNGEGGAEAVNGCDGFAPKNHMATACDHAAIGAIPKSKPRTVRKKIKRERKQEKKARAEERHRQKFLGPVTDPSKLISSDDDDIHTVINETLKVLQI